MRRALKTIAIIHHQPLEMFPPVMNLLEYFSENLSDRFKIQVITSASGPTYEPFRNENITIKRLYEAKPGGGTARLLYNYTLFALRSWHYLIKWKPDVIFYFESHSALPVFFYYRFPGAKARLFIHYHEYMTPAEYSAKGMRMINFFRKKEEYLYKIADWISHTNEKRVELFLNDNPDVDSRRCHSLPNYPPSTWNSHRDPTPVHRYPIRVVYIGSFGSFDTLYVKEVLLWIREHAKEFVLDIYSFNITPQIAEFISGLEAGNINVKQNIEYRNLPAILKNYDVGLILYKATSLNFRFNAPNKLFEYIAAGLDVWFPKEMLGCYPYIREEYYPKVIKVDFCELSTFNYRQALDKTGIREMRTEFFSEKVYGPLADKIAAC